MQSDGNFVVYNARHLWANNRCCQTGNERGDYLAMQDDGNLVQYSASGHYRWASNSNFPAPIRPLGPDNAWLTAMNGDIGMLHAVGL